MPFSIPPSLRAVALAATLLAGASGAVHAADAAAAAASAPAVGQKPLPAAIVDALNVLSKGPHAGYRANHAKGVLVTGRFVPAKGAAALSTAPHFAQAAGVAVTVRFSNATGVPDMPDTSPNASPHGMAIRFALPDGNSTDIVAISANGFPVATPEDFLALLTAVGQSGPDAPKPTPIETFLGSHPAAAKFVTTPRPVPVSFGTLAFYGVNAFKFTNARGETRFARYQIVPVAGAHALTTQQSAQAQPDHLMAELPARMAKGPVRFKLIAQLAEPGDPTNDPTAVWPGTRKRIELGTISLTQLAPDQVAAQKALLFNPLSVPEGIAPSDDPVLLARPAAYGVSFTQRLH